MLLGKNKQKHHDMSERDTNRVKIPWVDLLLGHIDGYKYHRRIHNTKGKAY